MQLNASDSCTSQYYSSFSKLNFCRCISFLYFEKIKKATTPATAINIPYSANKPVDTKRNNHITIEIITGIGNKNILKGKSFLPNLPLNNITPIPCAIN